MSVNTAIMGIINMTPDSFSDGGDYQQIEKAVIQAEKMEQEGAVLLDIGGESSRPGAQSVTLEEELKRITPLLESFKKRQLKSTLSIDTVKPEVMQRAIDHGVKFINDISAFNNPHSLEVIKPHQDVELCLMHMQGTPATMQNAPQYHDVVKDILHFFTLKIKQLKQQGIEPERLYIDPGFGFGKTLEHNLTLFRHIARFKAFSQEQGCRGVLIGVSRKGFIGQISGVPQLKDAKNRVIGNVIAAILAAAQGADIIRVHDVKETVQALMTHQALSIH